MLIREVCTFDRLRLNLIDDIGNMSDNEVFKLAKEFYGKNNFYQNMRVEDDVVEFDREVDMYEYMNMIPEEEWDQQYKNVK